MGGRKGRYLEKRLIGFLYRAKETFLDGYIETDDIYSIKHDKKRNYPLYFSWITSK